MKRRANIPDLILGIASKGAASSQQTGLSTGRAQVGNPELKSIFVGWDRMGWGQQECGLQ